MTLYHHVPHPHWESRKRHGPVKIADQLPAGNPVTRFNTWLALKVTASVGTMWCAYIFCILAVIGIPAAIGPGGVGIVNWFTEEFIQLVLLSVIMVGQLIQGTAADKRAESTYLDTETILHGHDQMAAHLAKQDEVLLTIAALLGVNTSTFTTGTPPAAEPQTGADNAH